MRRPAAVAIAVVLGLLVGCGGSDSETADRTPATTSAQGGAPLTHAQLVARLDRLCTAFTRDSSGLGEKFSEYARLVELSRRFDQDLAGLEPPPGDAAEFERYRQASSRQTALLEEIADAYRSGGESRAVEANNRASPVSSEAIRQLTSAATALGSRGCAPS